MLNDNREKRSPAPEHGNKEESQVIIKIIERVRVWVDASGNLKIENIPMSRIMKDIE